MPQKAHFENLLFCRLRLFLQSNLPSIYVYVHICIFSKSKGFTGRQIKNISNNMISELKASQNKYRIFYDIRILLHYYIFNFLSFFLSLLWLCRYLFLHYWENSFWLCIGQDLGHFTGPILEIEGSVRFLQKGTFSTNVYSKVIRI